MAAAIPALLLNPVTIAALAQTARFITEWLLSLSRDETLSPELRAAAQLEATAMISLAERVKAEALADLGRVSGPSRGE